MIPTRISGLRRYSLLVAIHRGKECIGVDFFRCRCPMLNFLQAELKLGAGRCPLGVENFVLKRSEFILDELACTHVRHH